MRLRECGRQLESAAGGRVRLRQHPLRLGEAVLRDQRAGVSEAGVGQGIVGVEGKRLAKARERFLEAEAPLLPVVATFQVEMIRVEALRGRRNDWGPLA